MWIHGNHAMMVKRRRRRTSGCGVVIVITTGGVTCNGPTVDIYRERDGWC